jgi:hypothetical protein
MVFFFFFFKFLSPPQVHSSLRPHPFLKTRCRHLINVTVFSFFFWQTEEVDDDRFAILATSKKLLDDVVAAMQDPPCKCSWSYVFLNASVDRISGAFQ